jgi:hypothetical protein
MKWLADAVHGEHCRLGIYMAPNYSGWGGMPVTYLTNAFQDAMTFLSWGVDHVRGDGCGSQEFDDLFAQGLDWFVSTNGGASRVSFEMHPGVLANPPNFNAPIAFGPFLVEDCNVILTMGDASGWVDQMSCLENLGQNRYLTGVGHFQSINGLVSENHFLLPAGVDQTNCHRAQLGIMAMESSAGALSSGLGMAGSGIVGYSPAFTALLTNREMINIHHDPLCVAGWAIATNYWQRWNVSLATSSHDGQMLTNGGAVWTWRDTITGSNQIQTAATIGAESTNLFNALSANLLAGESVTMLGTNGVSLLGPSNLVVSASESWAVIANITASLANQSQPSGKSEVWIKPLSSGDFALAFWNWSLVDDSVVSVSFDSLPGFGTNILQLADVWGQTTFIATNCLSATVNAGGLNLYRIHKPGYR